MIELSKVRNDPQYAGNLVPGSWQLIAQEGRRASPRVVASHVAHFDLAPDGTVLYSNGYDIFSWSRGEQHKLNREALVEGLAAL